MFTDDLCASIEALFFAIDRTLSNPLMEETTSAILPSVYEKPISLFQKLKTKCKEMKAKAVEVYKVFLEEIKEEFTMLFNLYLNIRQLLKDEFNNLKKLFKANVIEWESVRKNRQRRQPTIRYLIKVRDVLYKCFGYIETEINKLPKEDKKNTTCPVQIELLAELGFFELKKVKEYSKTKLSEILSKILNKNVDSIRNNIRALDPYVTNYDISKYTVRRPNTTSKVKAILEA